MSKVIYKYTLETREFQVVRMPLGAKVLSVQMQGGTVTVWAETDTAQKETVRREFVIVGTGCSFPNMDMDDFTFLGTVQDGPFVWHVYVV